MKTHAQIRAGLKVGHDVAIYYGAPPWTSKSRTVRVRLTELYAHGASAVNPRTGTRYGFNYDSIVR